jgi:hypothetical protein
MTSFGHYETILRALRLFATKETYAYQGRHSG